MPHIHLTNGYNRACVSTETGEVVEWSIAPDSKSGIRLYRIVGSNPTLSANIQTHLISRWVFPWCNVNTRCAVASQVIPFLNHSYCHPDGSEGSCHNEILRFAQDDIALLKWKWN